MREEDMITFLNLYWKTITNILWLKSGELHTKVMQSVVKYMQNGYKSRPAIRMSLKKYKHQLEEYLYGDESEDDRDSEAGDNKEHDDEESYDEDY